MVSWVSEETEIEMSEVRVEYITASRLTSLAVNGSWSKMNRAQMWRGGRAVVAASAAKAALEKQQAGSRTGLLFVGGIQGYGVHNLWWY